MPSYEKRASGWTVRFREVASGEKKQVRLSGFTTKAEAEKAYKEYVAGYGHYFTIPKTEINTFGELFVVYNERQKTRVKESSYYTTEGQYQKHILPYFANMRIKDITAKDIIMWQNALSGYSYKYRKMLTTDLGAVFKFGSRYYDLPNPILKVEPLRNTVKKKETEVWSYEEFKQFISVVDDDTYRCLFRFLYITGCRKGEAFALAPTDLNVEKREVHIVKSLTRKTREAAYKITTPKTMSSYRVIHIPGDLMDDLVFISTPSDSFVFGGDKPLAENTVTRVFDKYIKLSGVKRITLHSLRHSCASYLLSKGVSIVAISKLLGHSSVKQTFDTYSHLLPEDNSKIIEAFSDL